MRSMLTRPGSHSHFIYARCAQSESWITNAVVADELELFEQCFDWVVNRMRWESMIDAGRAAMLKSLPAEDPDYNYFFARSSECPFPMEEDDDLDEDAYCWRSEVQIHGGEDKVTEADYKALAEVLAAFKVVKGASLFTRKGDALNRTLAAIPILTTAREKNRQLAPGPETTPLASVTAQRTVLDEMAAAETLPEIGLGEEFSGDLDAMDDMLADEDATLTNQSAVEGVQAPTVIAEENTSATVEPEMIAADSASPSTAVGDLHFLDENAILQTVSSLIADEAHWKKAKPKPGTGNVTQKQLENETKKKERPKAKKEQGTKQMFEWGDEDDLPLSVLRDRIAKSKRPLTLCRSEDDILTAPSTRKISMQLYMPHHFCKLSHIFVGEWGKLRINRASSAPLETPHDFRWIDSVVRDMQTNDQPTAGKSFMEFLSIFNGYFNDADERNIRAGSEPYLGGSSEDFFDDGVPQEDDDDLDNANTSANKLSNSMLHRSNRSFFSEADSDVEDAEMFGVKYSIRQRRINAPAVKRAIGTVLSNRELDADMLNAQLRLARQLKLDETIKLRDGDVSIVSESGELDLSLVDSRKNGLLDMSAEEEQLQIREENEMGDDPTCELHKSDVKVSNVTLSGRHTFSSLLVRVPDYLTGRTANDLNPINAFSVLLHMCNENNLELAQRRDSNNMVLPSAMGDFTILPSRRNKRKHE
uniref:Condensin complex subunit 2 n=2 Tax=Parascaris univalens TaxID=6257 RepID=A0A915C613_PARUN